MFTSDTDTQLVDGTVKAQSASSFDGVSPQLTRVGVKVRELSVNLDWDRIASVETEGEVGLRRLHENS